VTLEELIEQIKQYCDEYEKLCELHFVTDNIDTKISLERQMRVLRVSQLWPTRERITETIHAMERAAQDRAWERAKERRNGTNNLQE